MPIRVTTKPTTSEPPACVAGSTCGGGSAADGTFTDTTDLLINATNGNVVDPNAPTPTDDFSVAGSVGQWAAFGTNFSVTLSGMASADSTPGPNLGAKLSDGGIDRASNGDFGIRDNDDVGPNTAGIDALEGLLVGLDASNLDPSLAFQITGIEVGGVNAPETGTIVNRNDTSKSVGFSASGLVDVSSLDLIINGGISDSELVSIFGDNFGEGNFRIVGFTLKVVNSASDLFTLNSLGSGLEGDTEYSETALLNIAADGTISDTLGFAVTGSTTLASALSSNCSITVNGMSSVDATTDLGAKLADGGIDRASNGDFGIRDSDGAGSKGNGIDALEGFLIGWMRPTSLQAWPFRSWSFSSAASPIPRPEPSSIATTPARASASATPAVVPRSNWVEDSSMSAR